MNRVVFTVFVLPLLIGAIIRWMLLKWKRGYMISGAFVLLSVMVWLLTKHLVDHGADGTVMLWAWIMTMLTAGSLIVGGISLLIKKINH